MQNHLFLILLFIALKFVITPVLAKKLAGRITDTGGTETSRIRKQNFQFTICLGLALAIFLFSWSNPVRWEMLALIAFGFFNALAAYAQWQATAISLSGTATLNLLDDVVGMGLAAIVMHEQRDLPHFFALLGGLCFFSVLSFHLFSREKGKEEQWKQLVKWVSISGAIWGVAIFLMRYFPTVKQVPFGQFMIGQYLGSYLGSTLLLKTIGRREEMEKKLRTHLTAAEKKMTAALAIVVASSLLMNLVVMSKIPILAIQPVLLVVEMTVPAIIGLFVFKEIQQWEKIRRGGWKTQTALVIGIAAAATIIALI